MRLSILDQSPIRKNSNAREALQETVQLAQLADRLGYTRFWVSEHHNTTMLAGSTPEVLISHLAGQTHRIRVGSGGIMLPHYSALKVAENFRMLEALFPGRIDLGLGRAPGGDRLTASVLNPSNQFNERDFVQQLYDLQHYLDDSHEPGSVQARVRAMPAASTVPAQWVLSSSGQSAALAAHFGMGFSFAHFINPVGGAQAVEAYRKNFKPSVHLPEPEANAAFFMFCSEDEQLVREQQAITDHRFLQFETKGKFEHIDYEEVVGITYNLAEQARINHNRHRMIMGTPDVVKAKLLAQANAYKVDEIVLANLASRFEDRLQSYQLLADVFELKGTEVAV